MWITLTLALIAVSIATQQRRTAGWRHFSTVTAIAAAVTALVAAGQLVT